jgi:oxygen-independent coproporphyrinogen-3 oxidase
MPTTGSQPLYVYAHVPFCASKCVYCDFYVTLAKYGGQEAYLQALLREWQLRSDFLKTSSSLWHLETLYMGGGTPSLLTASAYESLFQAMSGCLALPSTAEITLEANPNAMASTPADYLSVGFNRVSVGVQSFQDGELKKLSRIHTADAAFEFIEKLSEQGFQNISLDLMYGIPGQTLNSWSDTLTRALALPIQHLSLYGLKVEEATPLARLVQTGAYPLPDEEMTVSMYEMACQVLAENGFHRYEFSNFARPGFESRHNLRYWDFEDWLALGPSAHGLWQGVRYENAADLAQYLNDPLGGSSETLSPQVQLENALIFGLRKTEGVSIRAIEARFQVSLAERYAGPLQRYVDQGFLVWNSHTLRLTERGVPVSNAILAVFLAD